MKNNNYTKCSIYQNDIRNALENVVNLQKLCNKTIMITGATGLIGSFLVESLLKYNEVDNAGIDIYAVSRNIEKLGKRFSFYDDSRLHFLEHELSKEIEFDVNIDYIIHAAANAYPALFADNPTETLCDCIEGTKKYLDYGRKHGMIRFLYISSGEVYGISSKDELSECDNGYIDWLNFRACYPMGKRASENLCIDYKEQYNCNIVIARPSHVYGSYTSDNDNRASVQFMNNVLRGINIILKSEGSQVRSYTYIADCCSGILSILTSGENGEAYNISSKESIVSIREYAEQLALIAGRTVEFQVPEKKEMKQRTLVDRQVLCNEKLHLLGWNEQYSIYQGLRNTYEISKWELQE